MPDRIDEFITALQDELETVKQSKASTNYLSKGRLVGQLNNTWIYSFTSSYIVNSEDESPATIEVEGTGNNCSIVTAQGLQVEIAVSRDFGPLILSAKLSINRTALLVRLIEKFREAKSGNLAALQFAEEVFAGKSKQISKFGAKAKYSFQNHNSPNVSQAEAIENSFRNSLAVIWGPPGTGKTRTIARAVEAHLEAGRRVLLAAHANAAVDAALEDIAAQLKDSYYARGEIIRLGAPKNSILPKKFPLLIVDQVTAQKSAALIAERDQFEATLQALEEDIKQCKHLKKAADLVRELEKESQRPTKATSQHQSYQQIKKDIERAELQLALAQQNQLHSAQDTHLRDLTIFIAGRQRFAREIEIKLEAEAARDGTLAERLEEATDAFLQIHKSTGISPNAVDERIKIADQKSIALSKQIKELETQIESN